MTFTEETEVPPPKRETRSQAGKTSENQRQKQPRPALVLWVPVILAATSDDLRLRTRYRLPARIGDFPVCG
jgi:hypothetical protein